MGREEGLGGLLPKIRELFDFPGVKADFAEKVGQLVFEGFDFLDEFGTPFDWGRKNRQLNRGNIESGLSPTRWKDHFHQIVTNEIVPGTGPEIIGGA